MNGPYRRGSWREAQGLCKTQIRTARFAIGQADRHRDDAFTWGDTVWAHWSRSAHVVLTQ